MPTTQLGTLASSQAVVRVPSPERAQTLRHRRQRRRRMLLLLLVLLEMLHPAEGLRAVQRLEQRRGAALGAARMERRNPSLLQGPVATEVDGAGLQHGPGSWLRHVRQADAKGEGVRPVRIM